MLDAETGNYYYGARYYTCPERSRRNPKWSLWLSVDPLAERYPGWSPYNYTLYNPVRFVDPDGRSVAMPDDWVLGKDGKYTWDPKVTSENDSDLNGRKYIGKSINDVAAHYRANNPISSRLGIEPEFGDTSNWTGEITSDPMTWLEDWSSGDNTLKKIAYEVANGYYLGAQAVDGDLLGKDYVNPLTGLRAFTNLDGSPQYDVGKRALSFISSVVPMLGEVKLLKGVKTLNASQFSSFFKGTFIPKASAKSRGLMNRTYNLGVKVFNSHINTSDTMISTLFDFYSE